jgi:O-antigen/teichoic acid export membrane protein
MEIHLPTDDIGAIEAQASTWSQPADIVTLPAETALGPAAAGGPAEGAPAGPTLETVGGAPRLARNLRALAGGQAVTWTMTLVWTLVVPRALGPVGLGILVSAQAVAGVLAIALGLGTRNYLVREIVSRGEVGPKLVGTALVLRLALAPIVELCAVAWAHLAHYSADASLVLYLITAVTILGLLAEPMQAGLQAVERMEYLAYSDIINKTAQSLVGIGLVLIGFRVVAVAVNMTAAALIVLVLTALWLRPFLRVDMRTNAQAISHMVRQSSAYWAYGIFGFVYFWIDTIMLTLMTDSKVVGWYGATSTLFQTFMFLPVLISTAWLPRMVAAFEKGDGDLTAVSRTPIEFILVISVPLAAAIGLGSHLMVHTVYGVHYAAAVPVMVILACCIPPIFLNIMLAQVLLAAKRQARWTAVMAGAAVFNPLLNLVLIPLTQHAYHNGAIGAAISLVATELLMDIVGFAMVGRHVVQRSGVRRCLLAIVASGAMCGVWFAARPLGSLPSLAVAGATFVVLAAGLRILTAQEIAVFKSGLVRLRGRRGEAAVAETQS